MTPRIQQIGNIFRIRNGVGFAHTARQPHGLKAFERLRRPIIICRLKISQRATTYFFSHGRQSNIRTINFQQV